MKCPSCNRETPGVNRNNRGIHCHWCMERLPLTEVEKPQPKAEPKKAPAKKK